MTSSNSPSRTGLPPDGISRVLQLLTIGLAACLAVASVFDGLPVPAARGGLVVLFAGQIWLESRGRVAAFPVSPPFLLSAVAMTAFSLIPAGIYAALQLYAASNPDPGLGLAGSYRPEVVAYFGSRAESLILAFCAVGLAVHGCARCLAARRRADVDRPSTDGKTCARLFFGMSAVLAAIYLAATQSGLPGPASVALLRTGFGPVQSFLLIYLLHDALVRRNIGVAAVGVLIAANVLAMMLAHAGKIPALIVLSAFLQYVVVRHVSPGRLIKAGLAFALFLVIGMQVVQTVRIPFASVAADDGRVLRNATRVMAAKLLWRQAETGYCLSNVLQRHRNEPLSAAAQTFWLKILVPRILWPRKPDFSLGNAYAAAYCGLGNSPGHSASITLLGQPLIHGGLAGLALHGAFLMLVLGALGYVSISYPGLPRVVVFALLPWWVDFDQDFALYVGNLLKFGLFMVPLIAIARYGGGRSAPG